MVVKKLTKKEKELIELKKSRTRKQKTRNLSISEGLFYSIKNSFGDRYIIPFAIFINLSNSIVAFLTAILGLLSPLAQIFGSKMVEKVPRKKIVVKFVMAESFVWLTFILVGILFIKGLVPSIVPGLFLLFFSAHIIFIGIPAPAWFSWLGDIVSDKYRGRWISKRNLLIGFLTFLLVIGSGFFLDYMKKSGKAILGFSLFFGITFLARLQCSRIARKMYEPKIELKEPKNEKPFSFWSFLLRSPKTNFGKFSIFRFMFGFSIALYSSLISIYLLRNLGLNYVYYMVIVSSEILFSILLVEVWGKVADRYGNYKVIVMSTILIPIIPILWLLSDSVVYLVLVPSAIFGIAWSGFNIGASNFIYDNVSQEKRGKAVSYYNLMMGLGIFFGGGISAIMVKLLHTSVLDPVILIFLVSSLLTMGIVYYWIPKIREINESKGSKKSHGLGRFVFENIRPTVSAEAHQVMHMKRYFALK